MVLRSPLLRSLLLTSGGSALLVAPGGPTRSRYWRPRWRLTVTARVLGSVTRGGGAELLWFYALWGQLSPKHALLPSSHRFGTRLLRQRLRGRGPLDRIIVGPAILPA
ncbi:hypothetical protein NDU88_001048 [Pleurodeles waltl]|uniref:Secreted protein n=1 Tax=Pleurodeles waltl TaxID=8319 RepID=A0AAV7VZY3_PLEWA|nr:hypothetical protein NDU88_001048 [Pleurodeles waltl]